MLSILSVANPRTQLFSKLLKARKQPALMKSCSYDIILGPEKRTEENVLFPYPLFRKRGHMKEHAYLFK